MQLQMLGTRKLDAPGLSKHSVIQPDCLLFRAPVCNAIASTLMLWYDRIDPQMLGVHKVEEQHLQKELQAGA